MNILGIETSCDETAASVVKNGRDILSSVVATSLPFHRKYGGIIPEIASRRQLEFIQPVAQKALDAAQVSLAKIDAIAVTQTPGLIGSLLVGLSFARSLSLALNKPLLEVDHIRAHLYANCLIEKKKNAPGRGTSKKIILPRRVVLPAIGLVVSGGHTSLYEIKDWNQFTLLGRTRDDAAGEAFDKVAKILNLGYPGGPLIDRLARKGSNDSLRFPAAECAGTYDFSFSGIKTAVLYHTRRFVNMTEGDIERLAYSFQKSVVDILIKKSLQACRKREIKTLLVGGGVAANSALRERLSQAARAESLQIFTPPISLCMDNAAMVAGLGYHALQNGKKRILYSGN